MSYKIKVVKQYKGFWKNIWQYGFRWFLQNDTGGLVDAGSNSTIWGAKRSANKALETAKYAPKTVYEESK